MNRWLLISMFFGLLALAPRFAEAQRALSLDEALALALDRSPDVAEAQSRLAEAEARLRAARSGSSPTLKARGSYDYWTEDQRLFPATRNGESGVFGPDVLGADLVATLPIFTGGRVSGEKDAAEWNRKAAEDQFAWAKKTLTFQVTAIFYNLLAQDEVLRSLETAVRSMDEQQRSIQTMVDAGKAARVDLLRANVRRSELHALQVRERNNRTVLQRAWAALLGLDDAAAPVAKGSLERSEPAVCPDSAACMKKALAQRPDYRAAQAFVASAEASVRAARAGYRPTLAAQVSYGGRWMIDASDQPEGTDDQVDVGRVALVAEIPLFDGRLTGAKVAEQKARLTGAQERVRKLELQIRFEVETAQSDIASAQERVRTTGEAVTQAEESFRIVKEKYDLGKATMTDLLDAQTALVTAQAGYARALADARVAEARLKLAVGEMNP
jgi:outer membrane protein